MAAAAVVPWAGKRAREVLSGTYDGEDDSLIVHSSCDTSCKRARLAADELESSVLEKINRLAIRHQRPPQMQVQPTSPAANKDNLQSAAALLLRRDARLGTEDGDAKARVAGVLSSLERKIRTESEAKLQEEMNALRDQIACLSRENDILKRAAAVQSELCRKSQEDQARVVRGLTEVASHHLQRIWELEDANRSLAMKLKFGAHAANAIDVVSVVLRVPNDY